MTKYKPIFDGETVAVYHWAPPAHLNYKNFGDEIAPMIASKIINKNRQKIIEITHHSKERNKLLTVGSVFHQAVSGDIIWGSGVNGKNLPTSLKDIKEISISLVRGPLTRKFISDLGHDCPELYGDPGLIFPILFEDEIQKHISTIKNKEFAEFIFIPNLNDDRFLDQSLEKSLSNIKYISPRQSPCEVAAFISKAKLVFSSSLHGIVFADSYGIPVIPILSYFEPIFKYVDYFEGTGRSNIQFASNLQDALDYKPVDNAHFSIERIINSFPLTQIIP